MSNYYTYSIPGGNWFFCQHGFGVGADNFLEVFFGNRGESWRLVHVYVLGIYLYISYRGTLLLKVIILNSSKTRMVYMIHNHNLAMFLCVSIGGDLSLEQGVITLPSEYIITFWNKIGNTSLNTNSLKHFLSRRWLNSCRYSAGVSARPEGILTVPQRPTHARGLAQCSGSWCH